MNRRTLTNGTPADLSGGYVPSDDGPPWPGEQPVYDDGDAPQVLPMEAARPVATGAKQKTKPAGKAQPVNRSPDDPDRLAEAYSKATADPAGRTTLVQWRGEVFEWNRSYYRPYPDSDFKAVVGAWITGEFGRLNIAEVAG